jgi:two-component system chemotaxis response regulator CheB
VIGGSAGALEALKQILGGLHPRLQPAVFVVIHTSAEAPRVLPAILTRAGPFAASYAVDREPITGRHIYIAPPDHHILVEAGHVRVTHGPKENGFRPAIDPLFRSAAMAYGAGVIAIVLSGGQDDGTVGLSFVKATGGVAIVQAPDDASAPGMPESAIRHVPVDYVAPASEIPSILSTLTAGVGTSRRKPRLFGSPRIEAIDRAEAGTDLLHSERPPSGTLTPFTCPDCGGPLWERHESGLLRFRCHVGHSFTGETLVTEQSDAVDQAMWTALRTLEEGAALRQRMAAHARERGMNEIASDYETQAVNLEERAAVIRRALVVDDETRDDESAATVAARAKRATRR